MSGAETSALLEGHVEHTGVPGGTLVPARLRLDDGLDVPVVATWFRAPKSYTGEDSLELQLPGSPVLLERVIDGLIGSAARRGIAARRAEPGEFTARAYLSGRIDLAEAEGVAATIAARTDAQLRAAALLRQGRLGKLADALAGELAALLAQVEAGIDFTDQEDVVAIGPAPLLERAAGLRRRVDEILDRAVGAERLEAIAWVVLTGPPNAGKSTLFNALLGRERAVVSSEPGTTRDVLVEPLTLQTPAGPAEVMLVDVAGEEAPGASALRLLAQDAARAARDRAELLLRCVPTDRALRSGLRPHTRSGRSAADSIGRCAMTQAVLTVRTKADLTPEPPGAAPPPPPQRRDELRVSARTGAGLDELRRAIASRTSASAFCLAADAIALQPRHEALLRAASEHVRAAIEVVAAARGARQLRDPELVAAALRGALDAIGAIGGRVTPDEILGRIFATFCNGK